MSAADVQAAKPPSFIVTIFSMLVRHGLTTLAGALATWGVIQPSQTAQAESLGMSAAIWALGVGWSYWQKSQAVKNTAAQVAVAKATA